MTFPYFLTDQASLIAASLRHMKLLFASMAMATMLSAVHSALGAQGSVCQIVFVNDWNGRDAPDEIYVMNSDGTAPRRVTVTPPPPGGFPGNNLFPRWAPDRKRIAFTSARDGAPKLYLINADGSGMSRLTNFFSGWGVWSPDGTRIAFAGRSAAESDTGEVMVVNADGSSLKQITHHAAVAGHLDWSPDGLRIAFVSRRDGNLEIYAANADGTDALRLTANSADDDGPRWSPDGRKIAFQSLRDGNEEIYVMNADGTDQTRLTSDPRLDAWPSWSPDGKRIAFMRQVETVPGLRAPNGSDIFTMNPDGTDVNRMTHTAPANFNAFPDWGSGSACRR